MNVGITSNYTNLPMVHTELLKIFKVHILISKNLTQFLLFASGNNLDVYPFYNLRQKNCHHELRSDEGTIACLRVDFRKTWLTASERFNRSRRQWEVSRCYDELKIAAHDLNGGVTEFVGEGRGICGRRYFSNQWLFCSSSNRLDVDLVLDNRTHRRERFNMQVVSFVDVSIACRQRGLSTDSKRILDC